MDRAGRVGDSLAISRFKPRYSTGPGMFVPFAIADSILRPTLAEWARIETESPEPRFWLALYSKDAWAHVGEALRLDPTYSPACAVKIELILAAVEYNQHELPSGYLDDPGEDLDQLREADELTIHVDDRLVREAMCQKILTLRAGAEDWIRLKDQMKALAWTDRLSIWRGRRG